MIGGQRRAQGAARVTGGGLNPDILERPVAQQMAVGDTVQRHATGETKVL